MYLHRDGIPNHIGSSWHIYRDIIIQRGRREEINQIKDSTERIETIRIQLSKGAREGEERRGKQRDEIRENRENRNYSISPI